MGGETESKRQRDRQTESWAKFHGLLPYFVLFPQLEQEIKKLTDAYENLVKHSQKREALDRVMRLKLEGERKKLHDTNKELQGTCLLRVQHVYLGIIEVGSKTPRPDLGGCWSANVCWLLQKKKKKKKVPVVSLLTCYQFILLFSSDQLDRSLTQLSQKEVGSVQSE